MKWRVTLRKPNGNHRRSRPTPCRAAAEALLAALEAQDGTHAWLQAYYIAPRQVWANGNYDKLITNWHTIEERNLRRNP